MTKFIQYFIATYLGVFGCKYIINFLIEIIDIKFIMDFIKEHSGLYQLLLFAIGGMVINPGGINDRTKSWAIMLGLVTFLIIGFSDPNTKPK